MKGTNKLIRLPIHIYGKEWIIRLSAFHMGLNRQ